MKVTDPTAEAQYHAESQETAGSLRERLGTLAIYIIAFLYVSAHKARWLWVVFFMFCLLVPFIVAEHPYISALLIVGGFGCIVVVTLPNGTISHAPESHEPADMRGTNTIEAQR